MQLQEQPVEKGQHFTGVGEITRTCQSRFENLLVVDVRLEHSRDGHLSFRKSCVFHLIRIRKRQLRNRYSLKHRKKERVFNSNTIQYAWSPSTEPRLAFRRYHAVRTGWPLPTACICENTGERFPGALQ